MHFYGGKMKKISLFLILVLSIFMLSGCDDSSNNSDVGVFFNIDGEYGIESISLTEGFYGNIPISSEENIYLESQGQACYDTEDNDLVLLATTTPQYLEDNKSDDQPESMLMMLIDTDEDGNILKDGTGRVSGLTIDISVDAGEAGMIEFEADSIDLYIDNYGAEGEFIEGTFDGTLKQLIDEESGDSTIFTVTDGHFKLYRVQDDLLIFKSK